MLGPGLAVLAEQARLFGEGVAACMVLYCVTACSFGVEAIVAVCILGVTAIVADTLAAVCHYTLFVAFVVACGSGQLGVHNSSI